MRNDDEQTDVKPCIFSKNPICTLPDLKCSVFSKMNFNVSRDYFFLCPMKLFPPAVVRDVFFICAGCCVGKPDTHHVSRSGSSEGDPPDHVHHLHFCAAGTKFSSLRDDSLFKFCVAPKGVTPDHILNRPAQVRMVCALRPICSMTHA